MPTPLNKGSQLLLLFEPWNNIACIADQEVSGRNCIGVRVVLKNPHAHPLILRQQLQQLEPGKIDIVVLATGNKNTIEPIAGLLGHDLLRLGCHSLSRRHRKTGALRTIGPTNADQV